MALDLKRVLEGFQIEDASGATNSVTVGAHISILQGTGLPGGDASFQDAAGIGSVYHRRDAEANNLQVYYKWTTANNNSADWKVMSSQEYVDAVAQGLSWREPVLVLDNTTYADITAAETAANVGDTVDGISISADDRLLFTDLTTGNENVYIVSGSSGSWTFIEDTNFASDGDALLVQQGSWAETQWVYDGTQWVQFGSSDASELGFIRAFIGKTGAGSELPTYTGENIIVSASDNLEVAINKIDIAAGTGNITNTGGNWSISDDLAFSGTNGAGGTLTITTALDNLNAAIGDRTYTNNNVVTAGESVAASIDALDTAVGDLQSQSLVTTGSILASPTTLTSIPGAGTIPLAEADQIRWMVEMRDNGIPGQRRGFFVDAMTDGTTVDSAQGDITKLNGGVAGAGFAVVIVATDLVLQLRANANFDYVVRRVAYSHF